MSNPFAYQPEEYRQRPREYVPAVARTIIERLENGESLTEICQDRDMPLRGTVLRWVEANEDFAREYELARRIHTDVMVDEALAMSNGIDAPLAKVRVDSRLKLAAMMNPRKYGPRSYQAVDKDDADGGGIDHVDEVRRRLDRIAKRTEG